MDEIGPSRKDPPPPFTTAEKVVLLGLVGLLALGFFGYQLLMSWTACVSG
ncbi:MAG: hypothetical protein U0931_13895 [Vulcanimicrobiota bacterium]